MENEAGQKPSQVSSATSHEPRLVQPFLHGARVVVRAPSFAVLAPEGEFQSGAEGFYHEERRVLSRLAVSVQDSSVVAVRSRQLDEHAASFLAVVRDGEEMTADPEVFLERRIAVGAGRFEHRVHMSNAGPRRLRRVLDLAVGADLAPMSDIKSGYEGEELHPIWDGTALRWYGGESSVEVVVEPRPSHVDAKSGRLSVEVELGAGEGVDVTLVASIVQPQQAPLFRVPSGPAPWDQVEVDGGDARLGLLLKRAMEDLAGLLLEDVQSDPREPDRFVGAGAPWFLTLFGRDAIWAARMLLPVSTRLAAGTLRTLARRQGQITDARTGEQPGKIVHELRREAPEHRGGASLPPRYYGTIDATPLWISLLHDAWRWGMPEDEVASLLDAASSALTWMAAGGDADDDGLLEYIDESGTGLSNQGWRDSTDSIRWQDGRLAEAPIALAEVQAYAYRAALDGASLLDAFGRPDGEKWRSWAARLKERFDATYWLLGPLGRYPAVALDRDKRPVDSVTSTLGHLLGSGILTPADEASVASYLGSPELDSGLGLRTLSTDSVGFNPLGYHTGSVWPHDSAIAARGLALAGRGDLSVSVIRGLLDAAPSFEYRLPELFGGFGRDAAPPVPYPAACRPQAWSAAAAVSMLQTLLGLDVDVPNGTMKVRPLLGGLTPLWVRGLRIGDHPLEVRTDANHEVVLVTDAPVSSTPR